MAGADSGDDSLVHVALALDPAEEHLLAARLGERGLGLRAWRRADELVAGLSECVWLLIGRPPRIDWSRATRLRLLQVAGAGVDPLFPAVGLRDGVVVANARGVHADAVRDHAFALLLALARGLPEAAERQARRRWAPTPVAALAGRTLAVLGFGAVGARVVTTASSFGLRVRVLRRTARAEPELERVAFETRIDAALDGADFVVVCLPLTQRTRRLVDAAALSRLPPHGVLVDVSRGGVVDHAAVEAALRGGRLGAAALDVFEDEPLPPASPLWTCPRLLVTPHSAGFTPDYFARTLDVLLDNIARVRRGAAPATPVSREHEY